MINKIKIWDVVQPTDEWERGYAYIEYLHTGLKQTFSTRIEVKDQEEFWSGVFEPRYDFITGELIEDRDERYDTYNNETGEPEV